MKFNGRDSKTVDLRNLSKSDVKKLAQILMHISKSLPVGTKLTIKKVRPKRTEPVG